MTPRTARVWKNVEGTRWYVTTGHEWDEDRWPASYLIDAPCVSWRHAIDRANLWVRQGYR